MLFGISGVISHQNIKVFIVCASIGAFCGVVGLPYLDEKRWKENNLRNIITGMLAALVIAANFDTQIEGYLLAIFLGASAGLFGEIIVKNIRLP